MERAISDTVGLGFSETRLAVALAEPDDEKTSQSLINAVLEPIETIDEVLRQNYAVRRILVQEAMEQLQVSEDRIHLMIAERLEEKNG